MVKAHVFHSDSVPCVGVIELDDSRHPTVHIRILLASYGRASKFVGHDFVSATEDPMGSAHAMVIERAVIEAEAMMHSEYLKKSREALGVSGPAAGRLEPADPLVLSRLRQSSQGRSSFDKMRSQVTDTKLLGLLAVYGSIEVGIVD